MGAPVDHAVAAVDQSLFIQAVKDLDNRLVASVVHREALTAPVAAVAHAAGLTDDASAVLVLPRPCAAQEFLTADVVLIQPCLLYTSKPTTRMLFRALGNMLLSVIANSCANACRVLRAMLIVCGQVRVT